MFFFSLYPEYCIIVEDDAMMIQIHNVNKIILQDRKDAAFNSDHIQEIYKPGQILHCIHIDILVYLIIFGGGM
ncbi:hypothetical protein TB2_043225 [Malus domestica]